MGTNSTFLKAICGICAALLITLANKPSVFAQVTYRTIDWTSLGANPTTVASVAGQTFSDIGTTLGIPGLRGVNLNLRYVFDGTGSPCLAASPGQQFYINGAGNINTNATWTGSQFYIYDGTLTVTLSIAFPMRWNNMGTSYMGGESLSMGPVALGGITSSHSGSGMVLTDDAISNSNAQCSPVVNYGFVQWTSSSAVTQIFAVANGGQGSVGSLQIGLYSVSGSVFDDGNALTDAGGALVNTFGATALNPVDGTSSIGTPLYVTLVNDVTGIAIQTVPVSASGAYLFSDVAIGSYRTVLSTNLAGTTLSDSPLPNGWDNTGEQIGSTPSGTDGIANGVLTGITITDANVTDANFGINKKPVVADHTDVSRANPGGITTSPVSVSMFSGTDQEDGSYAGNLAGRIVDLEPGTNGDVYYNGTLVIAGDPSISNFDPTLITVDPMGSNNQTALTVTFTYTVTDDAGVKSDPKTIQVPFTSDPLPVTLVSFVASPIGETAVSLEWSTTDERNSNKFEIQRSSDGMQWAYIATVSAKGNSSMLTWYNYIDANPIKGLNMYRLKMIDLDNSFAYSKIQAISFNKTPDENVTVYPNPSSNILSLKGISVLSVKEIILLSANGQVLIKSNQISSEQINVSKLTPGIYTLKVIDTNGIQSIHKVSIVK